MRRRLLFTVILLCALTLSGWGSVLASALCPHMARASAVAHAAAAEGMDDDHDCCPAKRAETQKHCSDSSHEAAGEMEEMHGSKAEPQLLAQPSEPCSHCVSHSSLPPTPVSPRESHQSSSEVKHAATQEAKSFAPSDAGYVSAIIPVQGAPPVPPARKHLLLSVFLI
ncbi:MAG TPA: hypothetical protein VF553_14215 [Pyrinomonadaceae bacterium]|jgi:hypothetical protein